MQKMYTWACRGAPPAPWACRILTPVLLALSFSDRELRHAAKRHAQRERCCGQRYQYPRQCLHSDTQ